MDCFNFLHDLMARKEGKVNHEECVLFCKKKRCVTTFKRKWGGKCKPLRERSGPLLNSSRIHQGSWIVYKGSRFSSASTDMLPCRHHVPFLPSQGPCPYYRRHVSVENPNFFSSARVWSSASSAPCLQEQGVFDWGGPQVLIPSYVAVFHP